LFAHLPEPAATQRLAHVAAEAYGARSPSHVVPASGTQILMTQLAGLMKPGRVAILGPTYAEHARAAKLADHTVIEVTRTEDLTGADLAVVVNPNNPDGRIVSREALLRLADAMRTNNGMLVVDEAFMDVGPDETSLAGDVGCGNVVVLRSFGKFFGLAGLRLGFAIADASITARLAAALGPWPVSGAAIAIGEAAMSDRTWIAASRASLAAEIVRLEKLLSSGGLSIVGGTSLFRLVRMHDASRLFEHLGQQGILVRRFPEHPRWLRFGLPSNEDQWDRLRDALAGANENVSLTG
jgi:cobalamin biosynthetic protein CobC